MVKLILPVFVSLLVTLFYGIRSLKNLKKLPAILIKTTVISFVFLTLGTIWWWITEPDGIGQVIQSIIYGICFVLIIIINAIVFVMVKKKS